MSRSMNVCELDDGCCTADALATFPGAAARRSCRSLTGNEQHCCCAGDRRQGSSIRSCWVTSVSLNVLAELRLRPCTDANQWTQ
jgi:hypothetical protein